MGLMLHEKAKQLIKRQKYEDSLLVLAMGEVGCNTTSLFVLFLFFQMFSSFLISKIYLWD